VTKSGKPLDRSNILHDMKALCAKAGVERTKVFPHNLRHLFACVYYKASKDISRLADILGHSNINTTRIYTSISVSEHARQLDQLGLVL
jgi:site-specific recombinase XerD